MKPAYWFGIIVLFTVLTILIVYVVPSGSTFFLFRYVFGFIFVAILPGYCLVNILFRKESKLDLVEEAVLSVALSFGIAGLAGLLLGLSPIGLNFNSVTISLSAIVLVLATAAFLLKSMELRKLHVQGTERVGS